MLCRFLKRLFSLKPDFGDRSEIHIGKAEALYQMVLLNPAWCSCLESDAASPVRTSTNVTKPKSHVKLVAVIAVAVIAVVVGAFLVSTLILSPQGQNAWLFKGAYAKYEGSTSFTSGDIDIYDLYMSIDFTVRLEVVDFNSTHALVSTSFRMSSSIDSPFGETDGETVEDENSAWVPLSQMGFMNAFEEVDLTKSYESTVDIAGFGTKACMVYEYALSDEGLTMTVYVDEAIGWPLKMKVSMTGEGSLSLELDIDLVETNIPGLK
jgi:hypothetical protein